MVCRGVRGATTAAEDTREAILTATRELLARMIEANQIHPDDLAAAFFTTSEDLQAAFPAAAARDLGWIHVPLLDAQEIPVPGSLARCIRIMLLWNTDRTPEEISHIYLRKAETLRPDLNANTNHENRTMEGE